MRIVSVLLPLLLAVSVSGFTEFGAHGGIIMPTGDAGDVYGSLSPMFGVNILVHMPTVAVEGSISYAILGSENDEDEWSAHLIPIVGGIRSYTGPLFLGGGGGLYLSSVEFQDSTGTEHSASETDFGAYGNAGIIFHAGSTDIEGSIKLHWIDFDDMWFSLTVGLYF